MKAVHEAFYWRWHLMTWRQKLRGIYLVYGFKFWTAVMEFGLSMQCKFLKHFKPAEDDADGT
jgi:hypothetical protein